MTRTLVTGAAGFIGSNLVRRLTADGHDVHCLVRPGSALWRLEGIEPRVTLHVAELAHSDAVAEVLSRVRPTWVFHLAVHGAYSFQNDVGKMLETNVVGTQNVLAAAVANGATAFVNTGSSSEYGPSLHAPDEYEVLAPDSYYAVTKAAATYLCRVTAKQSRAYIPTLRLYSVFGPFENERRLMPTLIRHALRGDWPPFAAPLIAHDFVYVDDVVDAYIRAASAQHPRPDGPVYNVGSGVQTTLQELADIARDVFNLRGEPTWDSYPARSWDRSMWLANPRRLQTDLGWQIHFDVAAGLRRMAEWLRRSDH